MMQGKGKIFEFLFCRRKLSYERDVILEESITLAGHEV
jgi:hypothetical protein